ncbi:hypothetical protein AMATHDRAFT_4461 [Amanita thiersii Skay4041]|uniref:Uncharacterized protein n=1 Tax=Amanita thiersii Skay4041 TaxID=703135 RepID=A0A2A9NQE8_9AGAR|nr:hypothetical protein AMATHDRAFT_4461 [Amanita thiersii Skay4041]
MMLVDTIVARRMVLLEGSDPEVVAVGAWRWRNCVSYRVIDSGSTTEGRRNTGPALEGVLTRQPRFVLQALRVTTFITTSIPHVLRTIRM